MATISTSQTFDSAARTAGEAFTIQAGAVLTIDSHTRDGKNSAISRLGSMGAFTMTAATGGKVVIDSSKVKYIKYDGLQGTPNVPAIGTILQGVTSGATGELMNLSAGISTVPTAAGVAMPATGIIMFKSITGTFQDNEIIEVQTGGLDLCTANGTQRTGWLEIVMDDTTTHTIGRAQEWVVNNDNITYWFESETVGSGAAHQQVQFPNYGGANFFLPGCWVDEAANGNWEFWPACITGTGTFWSASHMGTDARSKFCECLGGGIIRFGGNGTTAWGKIPTSGAKFRIPNVLLKSAAAASRSIDSVPHATTTSRPDFALTNAGSLRINGAIGHWNIVSSQAYALRLYNLALFDKYDISETASALDLYECHNGNYIIAQDTPAMILTTNLAGGTLQNCKWGRTGTIASADYGTNVSYCNGLTFIGCHFQNRTFRTNAAGYPAYIAVCTNITFTDCVNVGCSLYIVTCSGVTINNQQYADSYHTTASTTTPPVGAIQLQAGTNNVVITGFNWYTTVANIHPTTCVLYLNSAKNVKVRSIGTFASPLSAGTVNVMANFCNDGGNSAGLEFKRVYFNLLGNTFYLSLNNVKNVVIENCTGNSTVRKNLISAALNLLVKSLDAANIVPASTASIYGSSFYHIFTSSTAGRLGLKFHENSAEYAAYITKNFTTSATGTSGFNSNGGLALINSGDYVIFEFPYTIKGIDSFQNSAPTITTSTNMTIEFQIDTGSGWNGTWLTFNAANLSGQTVDEVAGFKFKIRCTANATNAANILTELYALTSSNSAAQDIKYPLDTAIITVNNVVPDSRVRIDKTSDSSVLFNELITGTSKDFVTDYTGEVKVTLRKASASPYYKEWFTITTVGSGVALTALQDRDDV